MGRRGEKSTCTIGIQNHCCIILYLLYSICLLYTCIMHTPAILKGNDGKRQMLRTWILAPHLRKETSFDLCLLACLHEICSIPPVAKGTQSYRIFGSPLFIIQKSRAFPRSLNFLRKATRALSLSLALTGLSKCQFDPVIWQYHRKRHQNTGNPMCEYIEQTVYKCYNTAHKCIEVYT